jgi:hypothetical protein
LSLFKIKFGSIKNSLIFVVVLYYFITFKISAMSNFPGEDEDYPDDDRDFFEDDRDDESCYSSTQQMWNDRLDYANESQCPIQAAERRMGA